MLSAGSLERLREMLPGLEVDPARMRANLDATLGLPLAESLMMALAPKIGRMEAHHRVEAVSKLALASNRPLAEVAKAEPAIAGNISAEEIDRALNPKNYLGSADAMIDAALEAARREMEERLMAEVTTGDGVRIHYEIEGRADGPPARLLQFARHQPPHVGRAGEGGGRARLPRHPLRPARPRQIGSAGRATTRWRGSPRT